MPRTFDTREEFEEAYPNIRAVGIGPDGELVVFVAQKVAESDLDDDEIVPDQVTIDGETRETDVSDLKGVPHLTSASGDVEWYATAPEDHRRRYRPIPGGVSIGNANIGAGTMGSPLLETEDGSAVTLTNAHVAANTAEQNQPAMMDGDGAPFGTLRETSDLDPSEPQTTDSALINVDRGEIDETILGIGPLDGFGEADFTHDTYTKSGRTTGVTEAPLRAVDTSVRVTYGEQTIRFTGCDVYGDMSGPGDSGSLIGHTNGIDGLIATSLLFAGSSQATIGIPVISGVFEEHGELTIPSDEDDGEEDDTGNGNGSDDSSDGSSGDGSGDGSDDDDGQDHTPEKNFEDYVEELLIEKYGEENVERQYYLQYSGRYVDLVAYDPENERTWALELENDKSSSLNGSGQALFYATSLKHENPDRGSVIPVLCVPAGHIDPEERHIIELAGVTVREIETPENVSIEGV